MQAHEKKTTQAAAYVGRGGPGVRLSEAQPADSPAVQSAQLVQFLRWLIPLVSGFAVLELFAYLAFGDAGTGITAAVLLGHDCLTVAAYALLASGRRGPAVVLICVAFLAATVVMIPYQPALVPTLAVAPLLAVAVALPYASRRVLGLLTVASWAVTTAVALLGELLPPRPLADLPPWYDGFFRVASLSTEAAVVLLLLWQFRVRLMGTLAQARTAEERLQREATHDALTGLPNRSLLSERLRRCMERASKDPSFDYAVLFLDLDRFKNINDSLGHTVGDELLKEIAGRLRSRVHPTDTVARLGGDEFVILLEGLAATGATEVAERLQDELGAPFKLHGHELFTTASIGVVVRPGGYDGPEELLRDADTAMYRAKEGGKARHAVFDAGMRQKAVSLLRLETDLRRAVEQKEFVVHYQPIVWLKSGRVVGFEALVRWQHPERGLVAPGEFVPLAEETGLISPIGLWVLGEACRQAALWRRRFPDQRPLGMSVNVSAAQFVRPDLPERVADALAENGLRGYDLALEITEGAISRDEEGAAAALARLKGLGVRIHVDDFGTGYSSLAALHRYPVDALKVDRSFVGRMQEGAGAKAGEGAEIVQTVSALAHQLGMDVVAEGVETDAQLGLLREMGCDRAQGFRFSRPVPAEAAEALLAAEPEW